jgi:hypothetical protein
VASRVFVGYHTVFTLELTPELLAFKYRSDRTDEINSGIRFGNVAVRPGSSAASTNALELCWLRNTILLLEAVQRIRTTASIPPSVGIEISRTTTSGCSFSKESLAARVVGLPKERADPLAVSVPRHRLLTNFSP